MPKLREAKVFWFFFSKKNILPSWCPMPHYGLFPALAAISAACVFVMTRIGTLDHPGARSSHTRPTPKGGGVGIVVAFVSGITLLFLGSPHPGIPAVPFAGLLAAAVGIAAVSYTDDVRDWSFTIKLGAQLTAALIAIVCGIRFRVLHLPSIGAVQTGWLGIPLTAAWVVFATNALNFIDGLNGLASGAVAIACLFLAGFAWAQADGFVQAASLVLAAGIVGFLPFNYPRARIFMGDVGSQFIGFISAILGVLASRFGAQTLSVLLVPMLLFGVYFDVVFTLARRFAAGDRLTEAHRSHLYQVAQRAGTPAPVVTLVHWAMVVWGGVCCIAFEAVSGRTKPLIPLAVVLPQVAWLIYVSRTAQRAGLPKW
jgi:UDP-GlcNAc:undecaprenyl-phosphate GlcNAc-1-phosphate transferase